MEESYKVYRDKHALARLHGVYSLRFLIEIIIEGKFNEVTMSTVDIDRDPDKANLEILCDGDKDKAKFLHRLMKEIKVVNRKGTVNTKYAGYFLKAMKELDKIA